MPKKRKVETKIINLTAFCGNCEQEVILESGNFSFYGSVGECEVCGSHGVVTASFSCPNCKKYHTVEVYEW